MEIKSKTFDFETYSVLKQDDEIKNALMKATQWLSDSSCVSGVSIKIINLETVYTHHGEQCGVRIFYIKTTIDVS